MIKKIILLLLLPFVICNCASQETVSTPKELEEIIQHFEYNDYQVFYKFVSNGNNHIYYKSNGNCYDIDALNNIKKTSCPIVYNGEVSYPQINVSLYLPIDSYNFGNQDFVFGENYYSYIGCLDNSDTEYTYVNYINEYEAIRFYDSTKDENYFYLISGKPKNDDYMSNYGTLSKSGENNCKQFLNQYNDLLKELDLSKTDLESFMPKYYEAYIKDNQEYINSSLQVQYTELEMIKLITDAGFTMAKSDDVVYIFNSSDEFVGVKFDENKEIFSKTYGNSTVYPKWGMIVYADGSPTAIINPEKEIVISSNGDILKGAPTSEEIETALKAKTLYSTFFARVKLTNRQIEQAIKYYYENYQQ